MSGRPPVGCFGFCYSYTDCEKACPWFEACYDKTAREHPNWMKPKMDNHKSSRRATK